MVLARDRLGKKPLVYRHEPGRLLFASELKSLLTVPGVPREVDRQSLDEYLTYQYVPHPHSILKGFARLPPAHYAVFEDDRLKVEKYWSIDARRERVRPLAEDAAELGSLLTDAVRLRMQSDVPWGAFLSGGVDSSLIVGLMQQLSAAPVKTFSIGFAQPEYDESRFARQMAQRFGTEHHELQVDFDQLDILPKLIWHFDEPMADSSAIATYCVSKLAREHVTVALTGDGGDELFAGYARYRASRLAGWLDGLPRPLRRLAGARFWQQLEPRSAAALLHAAPGGPLRPGGWPSRPSDGTSSGSPSWAKRGVPRSTPTTFWPRSPTPTRSTSLPAPSHVRPAAIRPRGPAWPISKPICRAT